MSNLRHAYTLFILACGTVCMLTGCPGAVSTSGHEGGDDEQGCGTRTANSIPAPGTVRATIRLEGAFSEDSALRMALRPSAALCAPTPNNTHMVDYHVAFDGRIVELGSFFRVCDRCLLIAPSESCEAGDTPPTSTPCADNGVALGHGGVGDVSGEYICIQRESSSVCINCSQSEGTWVSRYTGNITYRALGSLSDISVLNLCTGATEIVSVQLGDTVVEMYDTTYSYESLP